MRMAFSKLEWAGIALIFLGPALYLAGGVLAQLEVSRGQDRNREMLASITDGLEDTASEGALSRTLATAREKSSAALSHYSKVTYYNCAIYAGFTLFLFGIGLFLVGGRMRSLAAMPKSTGLHAGAEPSDDADAATPGEDKGHVAE